MVASGSSRVHRLTHRREFDAVFQRASLRCSSAEFLVLAIENGQEASRIGMVVSKKVAGTSVNRNRIRRLIRESFRRQFDRNGLDIVIVARPAVGSMENAVILRALLGLWEKLVNTSVKNPI